VVDCLSAFQIRYFVDVLICPLFGDTILKSRIFVMERIF